MVAGVGPAKAARRVSRAAWVAWPGCGEARHSPHALSQVFQRVNLPPAPWHRCCKAAQERVGVTAMAVRDDTLTLMGAGVLAYVGETLTHEAVGHGGMCVAIGLHVTRLAPLFMRCSAFSSAVVAAGPAANVVAAGLFLTVLLLARPARPLWSLLLWLPGRRCRHRFRRLARPVRRHHAVDCLEAASHSRCRSRVLWLPAPDGHIIPPVQRVRTGGCYAAPAPLDPARQCRRNRRLRRRTGWRPGPNFTSAAGCGHHADGGPQRHADGQRGPDTWHK
jgi:hypothetical protein